MQKIRIYCDGACKGNPGPGGWGAILIAGAHNKELSGGENPTTNNRMELLAAITALEHLKLACSVVVTSDSQYLVKGMTEWLPGWKRNNLMRGNEPMPNRDLWLRLIALSNKHEIDWQWVRGHSGHPENERCDEIANEFIRNALKNGYPASESQEENPFEPGGVAVPVQPDLFTASAEVSEPPPARHASSEAPEIPAGEDFDLLSGEQSGQKYQELMVRLEGKGAVCQLRGLIDELGGHDLYEMMILEKMHDLVNLVEAFVGKTKAEHIPAARITEVRILAELEMPTDIKAPAVAPTAEASKMEVPEVKAPEAKVPKAKIPRKKKEDPAAVEAPLKVKKPRGRPPKVPRPEAAV